MSEIKSAFELAMEKSRKYAISDEEREKIKEKEILQKAKSLFYRYSEGSLSMNEVLREIERMDEKMRERVKEVLLSQWVDALSLDQETEKSFLGIESIKGQNLSDIKEKVEKLLSSYREEIEKARQKMRSQLLDELRREGIEGDAVEPNLEESKDWEERLKIASKAYRQKLDEMKGDLKKLL